MARKSRDPQSAAVIHEMAPETQASYERMKQGGGVVGWSRQRDPWAWSNATDKDVWPGHDNANPGIWPPVVEAK